MKKICLVLLSVLLICTQLVSAMELDKEGLIDKFLSDNNYMDRVYNYDFYEKDNSEENDESLLLKKSNAVQVMLALNLMSADEEGFFDEKALLHYDEFEGVIQALTAGDQSLINSEENGKEADSFVTQHEAAFYLVGALGYDIYDRRYGTDNPRSFCASKIGLLDGIDFKGARNITRGEFAQMVYNALNISLIEQTVYGGVEKFEKITDTTLLNKRFNAAIFTGVVTAQSGIDIHSRVGVEEGWIKIDRALIDLKDLKINDYLGHRVIAVAEKNESSGTYELIYIDFNENDTTLKISSNDVSGISNNTLFYETGKEEKKVNLSNLKYVSVNGVNISVAQFLKELANFSGVFENFEGEIRFVEEKYRSGYTAAVVFQYQTFKVERISHVNEKIYLQEGLAYCGNSYIDINSERHINVIKNGETVDVKTIAAGNVISVLETDSCLNLFVSDKRIIGEITQIENEQVLIGENWYDISYAYDEACKVDLTIPKPELKMSGTYLLDVNNRIVAFSSDNTAYLYGFMRAIQRPTNGLDRCAAIRVFTMDNKWETYLLAKNLVFDGEPKVTESEAYSQMQFNKDKVCNALIRYKLNSKGEVSFLDTADKTEAEKYDADSITKGVPWQNKYNWTVSSKRIALTGSKYSIMSDAKVFTIPEDKEDETKGYSYGVPTFRADTEGNLQLYNIDDYYVSNLIVNNGAASVADFSRLYSWAVVTKKRWAVNSDGIEGLMLRVFDGTTTPNWKSRDIFVDTLIGEEAEKLTPGDIILMNVSGSTLKSFVVTCKLENIGVDASTNLGGDHSTTIGSVVSVDAERKLVKVRCGNEEYAYTMHSLGLYDTKTGNAEMVEIGDIQPGDRIFCGGGTLLMRMLIVR